jgi:hypothetical protein
VSVMPMVMLLRAVLDYFIILKSLRTITEQRSMLNLHQCLISMLQDHAPRSCTPQIRVCNHAG